MAQRRVILVVRDGWGYSEETEGNAVHLANTPNNDRYMREFPWVTLKCTGDAVGVPEGIQGGSEPGHLMMGAGRVILQPLTLINQSIDDGTFYLNKVINEALNKISETGGRLHLGGLLSDQGIHGTTHHLYALLETARRRGIRDVFIHCFLDGRDVPERSAKRYIEELQTNLSMLGFGEIASVMGRYYAMDRDTNWERTEIAYDLLTKGIGKVSNDPIQAINHQYRDDPEITDYYIKSISVRNPGSEPTILKDGDAFIFWNYRSDRARQITYALTQNDFTHFERRKILSLHFVCLSVYDQKLDLPVAFPQTGVEDNLGQTLSRAGQKQLRIAETEKYAHVTFFFNSQIEEPYRGETRILVSSPKIPNYADKPEMSASDITSRLIAEVDKNEYDFILVNYANGDLVGHSADLEAGILAAEEVDRCIGKLVESGLSNGYTILLTGDHGNIESMYYPDGTSNPSHGLNPVPFILISGESGLKSIKLRKNMGLSSISPTILDLMGLKIPDKMSSPSLLP